MKDKRIIPMGKKGLVLFIVNTIAFGSIMAQVADGYSFVSFLKILIPSTIIFGTCVSAAIAALTSRDRGDTSGGEDKSSRV